MDVWTMSRSWSKMRTCGYEIKVSRSDFKQDDKWQYYLPLCNQFYFACPKGLIKPEEVPGQCGLVYHVGKIVRSVKKAEWREVKIPEELYQYILMCRAKIVPTTFYNATYESQLDSWRKWLAERKEGQDLGYQVRRTISTEMERMKRKVEDMEVKVLQCATLERVMKDLNINPSSFSGERWMEERAKAALEAIPREFKDALNGLKYQVDEAHKKFFKGEL
jgi:hypothetical protein